MSLYKKSPKFDECLKGDNDIDVDSFLHASRGILPLIDPLGSALGPVKKDVAGNIQKIETKYKEDETKYALISGILAEEVCKKGSKPTKAGEAAVWLYRGLLFMSEFMSGLVNDCENNEADNSLSKVLSEAYAKALKEHHGFLAKGVFTVATKLVPYRKDVILRMKGDKTDLPDEQVVIEMKEYCATMAPVLALLQKQLEEKDLHKLKA